MVILMPQPSACWNFEQEPPDLLCGLVIFEFGSLMDPGVSLGVFVVSVSLATASNTVLPAHFQAEGLLHWHWHLPDEECLRALVVQFTVPKVVAAGERPSELVRIHSHSSVGSVSSEGRAFTWHPGLLL